MKKILSIVLSVFIGVTAIWAEEYTVTDYNYAGTATQYVNTFNTNAKNNDKQYVTMSVSPDATMNGSFIRPAGDPRAVAFTPAEVDKYMQLTAYSGCYIHAYSVTLGSDVGLNVGLGDAKPVALQVNSQPKYSTSWGSFSSWTNPDLEKEAGGEVKTKEFSSYNQNRITFYVGKVRKHAPDLRNIGVTIWVPEVLTGTSQKAPSSYEITEKPMSAGGKTNTHSITYNVAEGLKFADFKATVNMTSGKGQVKVTQTSFSGQKLIVKFVYEAAASDWECESYTADLVISSVNDFNTNTFTTKINGSGAGNVKSNNTLAWYFSSPQFVNAPLATLTTTNNPNPVEYTSNKEEYAKFETKDGVTTLKLLKATPAGQTVRLTARQEEYTDDATGGVKEATIQMDIAIRKRTPDFIFNPTGELYTSRTYNKYVSPRAGNDPNGTMHPTYSSEDADLFVVDASGNLTTKAGLGESNLRIVVESSDEWEPYNQPHPVTVARDPRHVPWCLNDELFDNTAFITSVTGSGAICEYTSDKLRLGNERGSDYTGTTYTKSVEMTFTGIPNILTITSVDMQDYGTQNLTIQQYYNGIWQSVDGGTITADATNLSLQLNAQATKLQFSYNGVGVVSIAGICVSERVDLAVEPETITLTKIADVITPLSFIASYSNMTEGTITINDGVLAADKFTISCAGKDPAQSLTLDYANGLGVDQNPNIPISVACAKPAEIDLNAVKDKVVATITVWATNGDTEVTKTVNVKIDGMDEIEMIDGVPAIIIPSNANPSDIWTGTNKNSNVFPYKTKRQVNLSRCFDTNTGMALFEILYIFGITTNTSGGDDINAPSESLACNAKTPCYVYHKGATGDRYEYQHTFDAASNRFDHGTTMNDQHIYFNGYCPFAYVGENSSQDGWMYFTGGNEKIDIYLDSCQIRTRFKTSTGMNAGYAPYSLMLYVKDVTSENINYLAGYSSPFVFTSTTKNTGTSYKPTIHIAGKNHLKGQLGAKISETKADITEVLGILGSLVDVPQINLGLGGVNTYSAPIAIKPTDVGQYTDLTLTDIWKDNTITNGYLRLDATDKSETALAIDLGSDHGSLTINGGQYHLRNSAADGNYTCNLAVGYKMYERTVEALEATIQAKLYGFGNDQADSKVIINAGTFTMYKNMDGTLGVDYYRDKTNFLDLRFPAGKGASRINGGSFNNISNVVLCKSTTSTGADPINGDDNWLILKDIEVNGYNTNGSAQFDLSAYSNAYTSPYVSYDLNKDIDNVRAGQLYGGQSANAYPKSGKQVVTLLIPGALFDLPEKSETEIRQWATAAPVLEATTILAGIVPQSLKIGGPISVDVSSTSENIVYETKQLLFADLEGLEGYEYTLSQQDAGMKIADGVSPIGQINNEGPFTIQEHLNIIKVVQADTWYAFTAPIDVHTISVVETSNEATIASKTKRSEAMTLQAQANLAMYYNIYTFIIPNSEGRTSSVTFDHLLNMSSVQAKRTVLKHYNGTNAADNNNGVSFAEANYFLYELDPTSLTADGDFPTDAVGNDLEIKWKAIKRNAGEPLLRKGQTYAIQFPYCPMCNDLETRKYNDYWSNKMILFYGAGGTDGQTINGTNYHTTILDASPASNHATLMGNSTFGSMTLPRNSAYIHDTTDDFFKLNTTNDATIKPTQGYLLYNSGASQMPKRISRSGKMIFGDNTTTDLEGVPTIGDRTSILLYDAMDGFEVLSLCEQLVMVYNLQGNLIFRQQMAEGEQVHIAAAEGIYVVKGEREAIKVMVD